MLDQSYAIGLESGCLPQQKKNTILYLHGPIAYLVVCVVDGRGLKSKVILLQSAILFQQLRLSVCLSNAHIYLNE